MTGFICGPRRYEFQGVTIEVPGIGGPCAIKANGDFYIRMPAHVSTALDAFCELSNEDAELYRVGGGCVQI